MSTFGCVIEKFGHIDFGGLGEFNQETASLFNFNQH